MSIPTTHIMARTAAIDTASALTLEGVQALSESKEKAIFGINKCREAGIFWQEACNHEQMTFECFQKLKGVSEGIDYGIVKTCIRLARNLPQPVTTYLEAQKAVQAVFECVGFLPEVHRRELQQASNESPVAWMLSTFSGIEARFKKLSIEELPRESQVTALDEVVRLRLHLSDVEGKLLKSLGMEQETA